MLLPAAAAPKTAQAAALATRALHDETTDPFGLATFGDRDRRWGAVGRAGQRLLALAAPGAFGGLGRGAYRGPQNVDEDSTGFAGSAVLLLALLTAAAVLRRRWAAGGGQSPAVPAAMAHEGLFLALAGLCLLVVAWPMGMAELLDRLPLLGPSPAYHRRLTLVLDLALAYLAAAALTRLERPPAVRAAGAPRSSPWRLARRALA